MKKRTKIDEKPYQQQSSYAIYAMKNSKKDPELSDKRMKRILQSIKVSIAVSPFVISLNNEPCRLLELRETIEGDRVVREIILNSCNPKTKNWRHHF